MRNGKKCNGIQLTKNKMDLNNRNYKNNAPSPVYYQYLYIFISYEIEKKKTPKVMIVSNQLL